MHKRFVTWFVSILVTCVVAGSCSSQAVVEKPVTPIMTDPGEQLVVVQRTVTPTAVSKGGVIVQTIFADVQTFNPLLAVDRWSVAVCKLMFEGLVAVDPFTGELVPNLAQAWTITKDGLVYTFTIRQGMFWSDGMPITAYDFLFTYQALLSGKLNTANNELVSNVQEITVLDAHTVSIRFAEPDCANLAKLALGWVPQHVFITGDADDAAGQIEAFDMARLADHDFNIRPTVFSGPFGLGEWVRGDHLSLLRNERYWRGAPHLDGVYTQIVSGQAELVRMLKRGTVDIADGLDPQYLVEVEQVPGLTIFTSLSDEYDFIGFQLGDPEDPQPRLNPDGTLNREHGEHPILGDKRVRQAIVHALDRDAIIAGARKGEGLPLEANVLPALSWAYNTDLKPRAYDVGLAEQLLEQAGWVMNSNTGIRAKNGQPLTLRLYTNAGNTVRETIAHLVKVQLAEVGIRVEVIPLELHAFWEVLFGQRFDLIVASWANLGANPDDTELWAAESDLPGKGDNFCSYYNPKIEADLKKAATMPSCDQDARAQLYRQIQAQLVEDQPYFWLDVARQFVVVNERVGGVNPGPWNVWYNVHEWTVQSIQEEE
jgi:peptide/nickel transport system substrate-binding protein